jgi:hypothetical protein
MLMASQALSAVVLPAGVAPTGQLRANIYLSPRLSGAATLAGFPDWLDWPDLIRRHGLSVSLACGGSTATVPVATGPLRPDIWQAIFTPETTVGAYPQPQYSQRLMVSYPARDVHSYVKYAWQFAATAAAAGQDGRLLPLLLDQLMFRDGTESTLDNALSQLRVTMWRNQTGQGDIGPQLAAPAPAPGRPEPAALAAAPARAAAMLLPPSGVRDTATRFALYHRMPPAPNRAPLPSSPEDFAALLDFHKALSALAAHPSLLPALGLVLPVELPAGLCPPSPASGSYLTLAVTALTPGWSWSEPPVLGQVATAFVRADGMFAAAPATDPATLAGGGSAPGDGIGGFLALDPAYFALTDVDLDGALLKAMALADSVAFAPAGTTVEQVLPSLRSGGISLIASQRADLLLQAIMDNEAFGAVLEGGAAPRALNARDLVRGYRLDIWSARSARWLSLHRRDGSYRFGADGAVSLAVTDEEGFTQLAVMQPADDPTRPEDPVATAAGAPQPGTDLYVNERVARWNGWSLSAPRPGQPLNRSADPAVAADPDPQAGQPVTPFKMTTQFAAHPGSLPQLRFGDRYRLRVRTVDLAGHSVAPDTPAGDQFTAPAGGTTLPHLRYEPVPHPVLVERALPGPGGSNAQLVIRSRNSGPSLDAVPSAETDERHVAPPRAAVQVVEQHGMLDDSSGRLRGDATSYAMIVGRDRGQFAASGDTPLEPGEQLAVPYFPDPLARGAALADLPHVPAGTESVISGGTLSYQAPADVVPLAGSVTQVSFGPGWPDRQPFRIRLADGTGPPSWDEAQRVLTVPLAKAESATVPLSCFVDPADLEMLGVWNWIRELYEQSQAAALEQGGAGTALVELTDELALLTRLVLDGGHEMITPQLSLSLVHAVQQPLGRPEWIRLPIVHHPEAPVAVPSVENRFWAVTAWRYAGSHAAVLLGALRVHGASTAVVDIEATWTEWLDDTAQPGPTRSPAAGAVDRIQLGALDSGTIFSDGSSTRTVAVYLPEVDTLWFAAPFDQLPGTSAPPDVAAPVHNLGDTKHRCISYRAVASSRFQEYFAPGLDFTRTSDGIMVDVPSSARPLAPDVLYVVPTFGWERQESTNLKTEVRFGNGLRIYLNRPWYSSGEGELLGVVLWPQSAPPPGDAQREASKEFITQWGLDPLWDAGSIGPVPATGDLTAAARTAQGLTISESGQLVDVAGHTVGYDAGRRLWYCDVVFGEVPAYMPFARLALARYQPSSIAGVELSHIVLADFAQLAPDRSASLALDPASTAQARLVVGGLAPDGPARSAVSVTVEARVAGIGSDLGWTPAPAASVAVSEDAPAPSQPESVLWSGTISFATPPRPGDFRVVVREFEQISSASSDTPGGRLVYAAILPFDFPASTGATR